MYKILLAVDGSENALRAAEHAAMLMEANRSITCTILTVIAFTRDLAEFVGMNPEQYDRRLLDRAAPILARAEKIFTSRGLTVDTVVRQGDVARTIVDFAGKGGYRHIIMGSRGLSDIKGVIVGSVSHKVLQLAGCPVTLVK